MRVPVESLSTAITDSETSFYDGNELQGLITHRKGGKWEENFVKSQSIVSWNPTSSQEIFGGSNVVVFEMTIYLLSL
jgi:hypothetical protein